MNRKILTDNGGSLRTELSTTVDQWRDALLSCQKSKYPEGKTLTELSKELSSPKSTVHDQLMRAVRDGRCKTYQDVRKGRITTVYVLETK